MIWVSQETRCLEDEGQKQEEKRESEEKEMERGQLERDDVDLESLLLLTEWLLNNCFQL